MKDPIIMKLHKDTNRKQEYVLFFLDIVDALFSFVLIPFGYVFRSSWAYLNHTLLAKTKIGK
jgi:hypothetical protein